MTMTPRERIMAVLQGEEPDKIPVVSWESLRIGEQGGWQERLTERGLGIIRLGFAYQPCFIYPLLMDPGHPDVKFTQDYYSEEGINKTRYSFETPVGVITSVSRMNPHEFLLPSTEEHFVKERIDWRVVNYLFRAQLDQMAPNYELFEMIEEGLGEKGITYGVVEKTPFSRAWVELATAERALIDFQEQPEEICEYVEIQTRLHHRIAGIMAESPVKIVNIVDHITDFIAPRYFNSYCLPIYEIYADALRGTDKILACHMDGRLGHLKEEIASSPLELIESFTVPPIGDISLSEAREKWPGRILFVNCPPHLNRSSPDEIRKGYEQLQDEWGTKNGLVIENSEDIPLEKVEMNLSIALDVFGY